tara:strand:+ start:1520 stop:2059 length:540 start_codon:yes stop_codon:yes gene_type:complete
MSEKEKQASTSANPAAVLGGVMLVGAAAGYAAIAFRFKNMHTAKKGMASAEMKAAEFMSDQAGRVDWSAAARAGTSAADAEAHAERLRQARGEHAQAREAREEARRRMGMQTAEEHGAAAALSELGLGGVPLRSLTRARVKAAYHAKAREVHPDATGVDPEAFKRVSKAYQEVLGRVST